MAGIFFWHNTNEYDPVAINAAFTSLDYKTGNYMEMGEWRTVVFPKNNYNIQNWLTFPDGAICCMGTFAYKGYVYEHSLPLIYDDIKSDRLYKNAFWGSFIILVNTPHGFTLVRDGAGLTRLYSLFDGQAFSTSLAGLMSCSNAKLNFDRAATTELLTTGVLTGTKTLLKEIKRINIGQKIDKINVIESTPAEMFKPKTREEALNQQIEITQAFFKKVKKDWFNYMPDSVFDVGITGGLDSRLVAILAANSQAPIILHTHWRQQKFANKDFRFANLFAKSTGFKINIKEVLTPLEMSQIQLENNFEQAYSLCDGVIRPGAYWDEVYSTSNYRSELTERPFLRFLGFGGEQYRNGERLPIQSQRSLRSWIRWEMIYRFAGNNFTSAVEQKKIENQIEEGILNQMGNVNLNLYNYKQYIRLVQSISYRSLQAQMENRLGFCISPFLDTCLSIPSLLAIPFLGKSLDFQLDMIARISSRMAKIPNEYGFNFTKGVPWRLKIGALIWQHFPPWIKHTLYAKTKNYYQSDFIPQLEKKHEFIRTLEDVVLQLGLPINLAKHRLVRSRSRLLLNLGYFLKRNERFIKC